MGVFNFDTELRVLNITPKKGRLTELTAYLESFFKLFYKKYKFWVVTDKNHIHLRISDSYEYFIVMSFDRHQPSTISFDVIDDKIKTCLTSIKEKRDNEDRRLKLIEKLKTQIISEFKKYNFIVNNYQIDINKSKITIKIHPLKIEFQKTKSPKFTIFQNEKYYQLNDLKISMIQLENAITELKDFNCEQFFVEYADASE